MALDHTFSDVQTLDMSVAEYRQRFSNIRVQIDWQQFDRENWPVQRVVIDRREDLLNLRSFFGERFGRINPRFLKTVGTRSMRIEEAARRIGEFPFAQRDLILGWADDYRAGRQEPRLAIPTFALPDNTVLVLDGNHHATALAIAEVPFELELMAISGRRSAGFAGMRFR